MVTRPPSPTASADAPPVTPPGANGRATAPLTFALRSAGTAKQIARVAGVSKSTAQRYRAGHSVPPVLELSRLMRWRIGIVAAVLRMAGLDDASMDAREARLTHDLHRLLAKHGISHEIGGSPDAESQEMDGTDQSGGVGRGAQSL